MTDPLATFPDTPLGHRAELQVGGAWTDVTPYLRTGQVSIGRGHPDESTTVSPSTLAMTLVNGDGRFSDNPMSPYWPYLVQNVPARVSVPAVSPHLRLEGDGGYQDDGAGYASCPDAAALHVTGTLDVRLDCALTDWRPSVLVSKWGGGALSGDSWSLSLNADGTLRIAWISGGGNLYVTSPPVPGRGRQVLRCVLSATSVTWYTGPAGGLAAGPWTQLGAVITFASSPLQSCTAPLVIGYSSGISSVDADRVYTRGLTGRVYGMQLYSGATLVASPDFTSAAAGAATVTDGQGNTWTPASGASVTDRDYRGHFEVPEWPQDIPEAGPDAPTVPVSGGGLLRRRGQGSNPVDSPLKRSYVRLTAADLLAAYWPMEDAEGSQSLASAIGGPPMSISGSPQLGSNPDFAASAGLPVLNGAVLTGLVPAYSGGTACVVRFLLSEASGSIGDGTVLLRAATNGTACAWYDVVYNTLSGGSLAISGYSAAGAQLWTSGPVLFSADGQPMLVEASIVQSGSTCAWHIDTMVPGALVQLGLAGSIGAAACGSVTRVTVNPSGALGQVTIGHAAVQGVYDAAQLVESGAPLNAWNGETVSARFGRLCSEEGIPFRLLAPPSGDPAMGNQTQQTLTQLLQECADTGRGIWTELRQQLGWGYMPVSGLYGQAPVTVDWAGGQVDLPGSPATRDDQQVANDVTVTQSVSGSTARAYAAPGQPVPGGRLSVLSPPGGVGTYDGTSVSVNLQQDADLQGVASWEVWRGTADVPRLPALTVSLDNRAVAPVRRQLLDLDLGGRADVGQPPPQLPPQLPQLAQQITETLTPFGYEMVITGVPYSPYLVAQAEAAVAGTDGSQLAAAVPAPASLLSGGGLESGSTAGWQATSCTLTAVTSPVQSGGYALQLTPNGTGSNPHGGSPPVPVTAGSTYSASGWALASAALAHAVALAVNWYDSTGTLISSSSSGAVTASASAWTYLAASGAAPAGAVTARVVPEITGTPAATEIAYFDDLTFATGTPYTLSVATTGPSGIPWATAAQGAGVPFDVMISGERMTVTAVTGASSPQSFTVVRAVNGVVKSQLAGAPVSVYPPPVAAL